MMYKVFESALASTFDLPTMLDKINMHHVVGNLTNDEREKQITLAREKANPLGSVDVMKKLNDLEERVRELEKRLTTEPEEGEGKDTVEEIVPNFVDGKWYYAGDKITYNGAVYTCIAPDGVVCVWNPDAHPAYWEIITA